MEQKGRRGSERYKWTGRVGKKRKGRCLRQICPRGPHTVWHTTFIQVSPSPVTLLKMFHSTEYMIDIHCEPKKNQQNVFWYTVYKNLTDCDKIWYILSWVNLSYRNVNVFRLTWIVSLPYLVKLIIWVQKVNPCENSQTVHISPHNSEP